MKRLAIWALLRFENIGLEISRVACELRHKLQPSLHPQALGYDDLDDEFEVAVQNTIPTPPPDAAEDETIGIPLKGSELEGSYAHRFGHSRTKW